MSAGLIPLFTSAPRILLRVDGFPVAWAIGFNVNVSVDVHLVQTIGHFSGIALEPSMYNAVTGTIQIMKLLSNTTKSTVSSKIPQNALIDKGTTVMVGSGADAVKVPVLNITPVPDSDSNAVATLNQLSMHLDPAKVLLSRTFDMDLYLSVQSAANLTTVASGSGIQSSGITTDQKLWMRIKQCRLVSRNVNISLGQLVNEPTNFQGLIATTIGSTESDENMKLDQAVTEKLTI